MYVLTYLLLFVREGSIRKYTLYMEQKWLNLMVVLKEPCSLPLGVAWSIPEPDSSMEFTWEKVAQVRI